MTTLEGLGTLDKPHPLQKAFIDEQAAQCGYCASGMIMAAADLLNRNPQPQEADVRAALAGNLCRCGTHNRIIRAVLRAAHRTGALTMNAPTRRAATFSSPPAASPRLQPERADSRARPGGASALFPAASDQPHAGWLDRASTPAGSVTVFTGKCELGRAS